MKQVKVWSVAVSLGGVESIVSVPQAERERLGITENLIRLSVGLEDPADLIDDLKLK